jgi:integrase
LIAYFKALKAKQHDDSILAGNCYNTEWDGFVCVDVMGNLIRTEYISLTFPKVLEKRGMRKIRFHDLRHTNATLLLGAGATLKEVQDWMGHKSILTTGNIYGHVMIQAKQKLSGAMCGIVGAV